MASDIMSHQRRTTEVVETSLNQDFISDVILHANRNMLRKRNDTISISQTFKFLNNPLLLCQLQLGKSLFSFLFVLITKAESCKVWHTSQVAILIQLSVFAESHCMR